MKCPKCGNDLLQAKDGGGFCATCRKLFPGEQPGVQTGSDRDLPRGEQLAGLIPKIPSTLSLVIDEYIREKDDYHALHRMCGAIEITARFLTVIALADVWGRRVSSDKSFPESLIKHLLQHMERPTLGSWRVLLEAAVDALPGKKDNKECLLPGVPEYVKKFTNELGSGKAKPLEKLLPMRNLLAHGGRLSDEMVTQLLEAHINRFEGLMNGLGFLSEESRGGSGRIAC